MRFEKFFECLVLCTAVFFAWQRELPARMENSYLVTVNRLTLECINFNKLTSCQKALMQTENLQEIAARHKMYACQTRTLGLGSDLILYSENEITNQRVLEMLEQVNKFCRDF